FQQSRGLAASGVLDNPTAQVLGLNGHSTPNDPAPAPSPPPPPTGGGLQLGSRGDAVRALQQKIMSFGWSLRGGADGVFGPATQSRVILFQKSNGLPATGVVDDATARAMGLNGSSAPAPAPAPAPSGGGSTADGFPSFDERGARVVALQQALINAGMTLRGGADGVFGGATSGAIQAFQRGRGLSATGKVDSATAAALGLSPAPAPGSGSSVGVALEAKPVGRPCDYRDTWQAARSEGRVHIGTDIIAPEGTPLYAVASGRITKIYTPATDARAGNGIRLTKSDGTYFFYGHMSALAPGIGIGSQVSAGQLVGYVGKTGNAGVPHLHLEVHPGGGAAINPYPLIRAIGAC
ncbi:MAG: peptidoglycan-binding protein, partial [Ilumatobacteraceae bacterium]